MCKLFRQISCKASIGFMNIGPRLGRYYTAAMVVYLMAAACTVPAYAATDIFAVARSIIIDVYNGIAGISTVLAGLMSWLKRIWIAWAIINGIGAFIAYIVPKFDGLATLEP